MRLTAGTDRGLGQSQLGYAQDTYGIQVGKDLIDRKTAQGNNERAGIAVNYLHSNVNFSNGISQQAGLGTDNGSLSASDIGLGVYYTNMAKDGTYLDLVGNIGRLHNRFNNSDTGKATQDGSHTTLSAEVGKPMWKSQNNWQLEPQAQLIYQYTHYQGFSDSALTVGSYSPDRLRGRVGLRLFKDDETATGLNNYYVIGNLLHDFMVAQNINISGSSIGQRYDRTRAEIGVGAQSHITKTRFVYADARYNKSLNGHSESGQVNIGLKIEW